MIALCCIIDWRREIAARPLATAAVAAMRIADDREPEAVVDAPPICLAGVRRDGDRDTWTSSDRAVVLHGQMQGPSPVGPDGAVDVAGLLADPPDGLYNLLVWDRREETLTVVPDLLGVKTLYYWHRDPLLVLASDLSAFRHVPAFSPQVNVRAVAAMFAICHPADHETLLGGVHMLPAGHAAVFSRERAAFTPRPLFQPTDAYRRAGRRTLIEAFDTCLDGATASWLGDCRKVAIALTAGVDSRLVLGYLAEQADEVSSATFGDPNEDEIVCAGEVARRAGIPHEVLALSPEMDLPEDRLRSFTPRYGWVAQGAETYWVPWEDLLRAQGRPVASGIYGGSVSGANLKWGLSLEKLAEPADGSPPPVRWYEQKRRSLALVRASRPEFAHLLTDAVSDTLAEAYRAIPAEYVYQRLMLLDFVTRQRRYIAHFINMASDVAPVVCPFYARRCLDFALNLPVRYLRWRRLERGLLWERFPKLARVRREDQSAPAGLPTGALRAAPVRLAAAAQAVVARLGRSRRHQAVSKSTMWSLVAKHRAVYAAGIRQAQPILGDSIDLEGIADAVENATGDVDWPTASRVHNVCRWLCALMDT